LNAEIDAIIRLSQGKKKLKNCQRPNLFSIIEHFIWLWSISLLCAAAVRGSDPAEEFARAASEQIAANGEQHSVLANPTSTRMKRLRHKLCALHKDS